MEALAISAANLNVIEDNLGAVAKELNGVLQNFKYYYYKCKTIYYV